MPIIVALVYPTTVDLALLAPAACDRRSPANYSRNIAITIRVIGNATNFHGAYIPYLEQFSSNYSLGR